MFQANVGRLINGSIATLQFELARMITLQRLSLAVVMALFPPAMVWVLATTGLIAFPEFIISVLCGMICLLSLLLWATPNVYTELEGRSWTFITSRSSGRWSILFGKFAVAFCWSFGVSWVALSLCVPIVDPEAFHIDLPIWRLWLVFSALLLLGSLVYSAIFSLFGVLIQRRAMVVAVGYILIFEVALAAIPANIGKITMSYHLFCLANIWAGWLGPPGFLDQDEFQLLHGLYPWWIHLPVILIATGFYLGLAALVIRIREYITLEDSQV